MCPFWFTIIRITVQFYLARSGIGIQNPTGGVMKGKMRKAIMLVAAVAAVLALLLTLGGCGKGGAAAGGAAAEGRARHPVEAAVLCRPRLEPARVRKRHQGVQHRGQQRDGHRCVHGRRAGAPGRNVPGPAEGDHRRLRQRRRLHGLARGRGGVRRLLPPGGALRDRRGRAVEPLGPERDLGGGLRRDRRRHLAVPGKLGPVQLRHHQADPAPGRPEGPAHVHVPHRRQVHDRSSAWSR